MTILYPWTPLSPQGPTNALEGLHRYGEAVRVWDKFLAVCPGPDADRFRVRRVLALCQSGDSRGAQDAADLLAAQPGLPDHATYDMACVFAQLIPAARRDPERPAAERDRHTEQNALRAVELLNRLKATGYFNAPERWEHLQKGDRDLDPLRGRTDFQTLLREVERVAPPHAR